MLYLTVLLRSVLIYNLEVSFRFHLTFLQLRIILLVIGIPDLSSPALRSRTHPSPMEDLLQQIFDPLDLRKVPSK